MGEKRDRDRDRERKGRGVLGNVAVDKDIAWTCAGENRFWDARVGASEPEDLFGMNMKV